jgi:NAD(P)H-dependent FMN reductase
MNILIVTQSSEEGINHKLSLFVDSIVNQSEQERPRVKRLNADKVTNRDIEDHPYQIWIVPEWNGSFPHTFKKLIDDSGYPSAFEGVEVLLIGTSDSTFGNLVGITHLQHILQWCGAHVFDKRVCLPFLRESIDSGKIYEDSRLREAIRKYIC